MRKKKMAMIALLCVLEIGFVVLAIPSRIPPHSPSATRALAQYCAKPTPETWNSWLREADKLRSEVIFVSRIFLALALANPVVFVYRVSPHSR